MGKGGVEMYQPTRQQVATAFTPDVQGDWPSAGARGRVAAASTILHNDPAQWSGPEALVFDLACVFSIAERFVWLEADAGEVASEVWHDAGQAGCDRASR